VQKPHPPVYIAGFVPQTFQRVAKYGNGWNPAGIMSFEALEAMIKQLQQTAKQAGRGEMEVVLRSFTILFNEPNPSARGPMMGTIDEIRDDTKRLRDIGVTHLVQSPPAMGFDPSAKLDDMLALMEQLIEVSK
jgi:alkanesulfonate monooxygenase SsuD/methylene tetrahydromethanopterin reductase-like flavin-dependent oxidoreductase (luciferase family)